MLRTNLIIWHGGGGKIPYKGWTYIDLKLDKNFTGIDETFQTLEDSGRLNWHLKPFTWHTSSYRTRVEAIIISAITDWFNAIEIELTLKAIDMAHIFIQDQGRGYHYMSYNWLVWGKWDWIDISSHLHGTHLHRGPGTAISSYQPYGLVCCK